MNTDLEEVCICIPTAGSLEDNNYKGGEKEQFIMAPLPLRHKSNITFYLYVILDQTLNLVWGVFVHAGLWSNQKYGD